MKTRVRSKCLDALNCRKWAVASDIHVYVKSLGVYFDSVSKFIELLPAEIYSWTPFLERFREGDP